VSTDGLGCAACWLAKAVRWRFLGRHARGGSVCSISVAGMRWSTPRSPCSRSRPGRHAGGTARHCERGGNSARCWS
jgi:hypothetical protein